MAKYFGTNGVRGRFDELDPALAMKLAQMIGAYFSKGRPAGKSAKAKIIIARDCRLTGGVLRDSVAAGLASVGCDIVDLGVASSPTAEYLVKKLGADGLIIITASHNPPEWNALKVVDGRGIAISKERGEKIEELLGAANAVQWDHVGKTTSYDRAVTDHIEAICGHIDRKKITERNKSKKLKVVLDCGNGTAASIAPKLFCDLGFEIMTINGHMDGRFPGRASEPSETNVKDLISAVKSIGADAGIAWDGDGDRVIFVDERGAYVIGDKVFALCILWKMMKAKPGKEGGDIVTTVATSKAVEDIATKFGASVRYTAIGAPYLCEEMTKKSALLGGEEVGGVIFPELCLAKDGFMTAAKLAEALCEKPLSGWLKEIPVYYNVKRKIEAKDAKMKSAIVERALSHAKAKKLVFITVDGVRVNLKDAWVIVRASGTENYVRVFAEARTESEAKRLADEYEKIAKG